MIEVGKKYCPVCVINNGYGHEQDDPLWIAGPGQYIQPCRYPWQTPIGVLNEDVSPSGNGGTEVVVRFSNKFELYFNNDYDTEEEPDIVGCSKYAGMLGVRVYYDANHSVYVTNTTNSCSPSVTSYTDWIGNYPGAATVGYISAVRADEDYENAGWVTVTIDPRPARSKYRVCPFLIHDVLQTPPTVGMPVTILIETKEAVQYNPDVYGKTCDGVIAGVAHKYAEGLYFVVVCTSGPAWIFPTKNTLYTIVSADELEASGYPSENVPITAEMSFCPSKEATASAPPRIGYVHFKTWYWRSPRAITENDYDDPYHIIADIDVEAPTLPAEEPEPPADVTDNRYYDDPEAEETATDGGQK